MEVLDKKLTKLPIDLYCITAKETNYPLRIFIVCKLIKSINFMNKSNFNFQRVNNKPHISWR